MANDYYCLCNKDENGKVEKIHQSKNYLFDLVSGMSDNAKEKYCIVKAPAGIILRVGERM